MFFINLAHKQNRLKDLRIENEALFYAKLISSIFGYHKRSIPNHKNQSSDILLSYPSIFCPVKGLLLVLPVQSANRLFKTSAAVAMLYIQNSRIAVHVSKIEN